MVKTFAESLHDFLLPFFLRKRGSLKVDENVLFSLKNVTKRFPGVLALDDVSIDVRHGEVLGLVGENGAGKSTMIKIISGVIAPDRGGTIAAFGGIYERLYPRQAKDLGIAAIYQDIDLVDNLTVADNIFLGSELVKKTALLIPENRNKLPTAFLIN